MTGLIMVNNNYQSMLRYLIRSFQLFIENSNTNMVKLTRSLLSTRLSLCITSIKHWIKALNLWQGQLSWIIPTNQNCNLQICDRANHHKQYQPIYIWILDPVLQICLGIWFWLVNTLPKSLESGWSKFLRKSLIQYWFWVWRFLAHNQVQTLFQFSENRIPRLMIDLV